MGIEYQEFDKPTAFWPRTTAERDAMDVPPDGTIIFNTDTWALEMCKDGHWGSVLGSAWDVLMEAETTGDIYFTDLTETDPAGRFRMRVSDGFVRMEQKTVAGDPGTWEDMFYGDSGGMAFPTERMVVMGSLYFYPPGTAEIAAGTFSAAGSTHFLVGTEGGVATDDVDTITDGEAGKLILVSPTDDDFTIVLKHNTGNILCAGNADITLDDIQDTCLLTYYAGTDKWFAFGPPPAATTMATDPLWAAAGDLAVGTGADTGGILSVTVPGAANLLNVLGVVNGDTTPGYKVLFDATVPAKLGVAAAGTGVVAAHVDHIHSNVVATHMGIGGAATLLTSTVLNVKETTTTAAAAFYGQVLDVTYNATSGTGISMYGLNLYSRYKGTTAGSCNVLGGVGVTVSQESSRALGTAYGVGVNLSSLSAGAWTTANCFYAAGSYASALPATVNTLYADLESLAPAGVVTGRGLWIGDPQSTNGIGVDIVHFTLDSGIRLGIRNASAYAATPSAAQVLAAGTAIVADAEIVQITMAADVTSTAAPTVADGQDGQLLTIVNVDSTDHYVLSDQGTLANSNLRLSATTITLHPRDSITLMYNTAIGDWVQLSTCDVI